MYTFFNDRLRDLRRRRADGEGGFTLIELLVVITILGILAAVTGYSVSGIGDKGLDNAKKQDESVLRTAEEAYIAKYGKAGTDYDLKDGGLLATYPFYKHISNVGGVSYSIVDSTTHRDQRRRFGVPAATGRHIRLLGQSP
jgi:prepilin-type N-terminal cleavage/methylation domain-containing protein